MKKLLVFGVIVLFLGISVIPSTGTTDVKQITIPVSSGNILYVGGNGQGNYSSIQDAIDNASDGDTVFVYDDSSPYEENIVVDKSINLIGEDRNTTVIDAGRVGDVVYISSNGVHISGFTLQNSGEDWQNAGIEISSNYNNITGNNISNNYHGIYLDWHSSSNNIEWNSDAGIIPHSSRNNTITDNIISNNYRYGIALSGSNNYIMNNSFSNDGLWVYDETYQNTVINNTVNGKPLVYLEGKSDEIITDAGQVILVNCDNITAENLNLSNTDVGIDLMKTNNSKIRNNYCSNNHYGIGLGESSRNTIVGNTIISNNGYGIRLRGSDSNTITGNNITLNSWCGISLNDCDSNTITGNNITLNSWCGISLIDCDSNTITGNTISNNDYGIDLDLGGDNNTITGNTISNNHRNGIDLGGDNNTITGNTISNNHRNGIDIRGDSNTITGNTISNTSYGIIIRWGNSNTISNNTISSNNGDGINLSGDGHIITGNTISSNNGDGINLGGDGHIITGNTISSNNGDGIHLDDYSKSNTITGNTIMNNGNGIYLDHSSNNTISNNNFRDNKRNSYFIGCKNEWKQNYWNRPRILPKLIFGVMEIRLYGAFGISIPWFNFDWRPALKPYDIGV